jgi:hypothetical protein
VMASSIATIVQRAEQDVAAAHAAHVVQTQAVERAAEPAKNLVELETDLTDLFDEEAILVPKKTRTGMPSGGKLRRLTQKPNIPPPPPPPTAEEIAAFSAELAAAKPPPSAAATPFQLRQAHHCTLWCRCHR